MVNAFVCNLLHKPKIEGKSTGQECLPLGVICQLYYQILRLTHTRGTIMRDQPLGKLFTEGLQVAGTTKSHKQLNYTFGVLRDKSLRLTLFMQIGSSLRDLSLQLDVGNVGGTCPFSCGNLKIRIKCGSPSTFLNKLR